jgi:hypothetical protein
MKKIIALILITFISISCEKDKKDEKILPDELGAKLFEVFKSNEEENLQPIMLRISETLQTYDESPQNLSEMPEDMRKKIENLKTNEVYQKKMDSSMYHKLNVYFKDARENLLAEIKSNISDYEIKNTYTEIYLIKENNMGRAIIEIQNNEGDKHYIGFEIVEILKDKWKLHDGIYLVESIGKDYKKYE